MSLTRHPVLTIGHSRHSLEAFVALLRQHGVTALVDVRSAPYSKFNPQFSREPLEKSLKELGITYVFLGRELGGRSEDPSCYEHGRVRYERLARTASFASGIERVIRAADDHQLALMCAEKDPLDCHRTLLVARALVEQGVEVLHVLADGRLEGHELAMERLLELHGLAAPDLFERPQDARVAEALMLQEGKVAHVQIGFVADADREPT